VLLDNDRNSVWHYLALGGHHAKLSLLIATDKLDLSNFRNNKGENVLASVPVDKKLIKSKYVATANPVMFSTGKNRRACVVLSASKKDQVEKQWVQKTTCSAYDLADAVREVFFGQLAVKIFGKAAAPKTKFNLQLPAVVSRILGDASCKADDIYKLLKNDYQIRFTKEAQLSLMQSLCYGVIVKDRDLSSTNLVVKYSVMDDFIVQSNEPNKIAVAQQTYGIDHELAFHEVKDRVGIVFEDFFRKCYSSRRELADIICTNAAKWSYKPGQFSDLSKVVSDRFNKLMTADVTDEDVKNTFLDIAQKIAAGDFQICKEVKQDIYDHITQTGSIYTKYFVDRVIMPQIDDLIKKLEKHVIFVRQYISESASASDSKRLKVGT
jgi:hypothetical protein